MEPRPAACWTSCLLKSRSSRRHPLRLLRPLTGRPQLAVAASRRRALYSIRRRRHRSSSSSSRWRAPQRRAPMRPQTAQMRT